MGEVATNGEGFGGVWAEHPLRAGEGASKVADRTAQLALVTEEAARAVEEHHTDRCVRVNGSVIGEGVDVGE